MKEVYFLYLLTFCWLVFASIQDLKKREVANWLNFSLIIFGFAFRTFYSVIHSDLNFFLFGIIGFAIFFCLAYLFYFIGLFAGGDAKLLMGFGVVLPYANFQEVLFLSIFFIFLLFLLGSIYSLFYSFFIAIKNKDNFIKKFKGQERKIKLLCVITIFFVLFSLILSNYMLLLIGVLLFFSFLLFIYLKIVETFMIKKISPTKLTEGDWLAKDIVIGKRIIRARAVGLTEEEIRFLKRKNKSVLIKEGIPFVPSFFFAFIFMVLALEFYGIHSFDFLLSYFFP